MGLTWIDWVIFAILGVGVWRGLMAGFVHQVAHLAGLLLGFVLGIHLMYPAGRALTSVLSISEKVAPLLGFVVVFIGVLLGIILVAQLVEQLIGAISLNAVNRLLGGALGALEAVLLVSLLLWVTDPYGWPDDRIRSSSVLVEPIEVVAAGAWSYSSELWPAINRLSRELSDEFQGYRVVIVRAEDGAAA